MLLFCSIGGFILIRQNQKALNLILVLTDAALCFSAMPLAYLIQMCIRDSFALGDRAFVVVSHSSGEITTVYMTDHFRLDKEVILAGLFLLLLLLFARGTGPVSYTHLVPGRKLSP